MDRWTRTLLMSVALVGLIGTTAATDVIAKSTSGISVSPVVDVTRDETSQNESPLAANPTNPMNMITGNNDWNYNDGCGMNVTFDGGKTWTPSLPNGFLPGVTKYTNDPNVPGTGAYDAGGDPVVAFGPDGTAYFVCQAFNFTPPYAIALLVNRSTDGGRTWLSTGLTQISAWNGNGKSRGGTGQFPDHESIHVDLSPSSPFYGSVYVTWAQFDGHGTHSPVYVAVSRDGARTFSTPAKVNVGSIRNNQDQRIVTAPDGTAYLTFDNGIQGGKGTALYVTSSSDGGLSWAAPYQFGLFNDPVCLFPPSCFNITGGAFRAGGSYPAPAYDAVRSRLYVAYADKTNGRAAIYLTYASASDLTAWSAPREIAPASGDRFAAELGIAPNGRIDVSFYDRSYSANTLVDMTYATSSDGGATWRTARVTPAGFDPSTWGVPSSSALGYRPFIGDYNAIVSTNENARLVWTGFAPPQPFNLEIDYATVTP